ncbi:hypothetical protein [Atopomonas sediminilitoris]|uniref:hypothetical protein n=1 Tax=Atopomonas sediminilitoris TaxID=2919919 RepID=UPI001F4E4628|nr:hypothetical protein [Atopomonas sediminilitoris]MCJ8170070.1 hypothetical protein [Atopomonas sediminilitoris]
MPTLPAAVAQADGSFELAEHRIIPLQPFTIEARVLGREDYRFDRGAALSPTDLALGWGPMSQPDVVANIRIRQSNRWYYWSVDSFPIPRREIETHSANMHMIPASAQVAEQLAKVKSGQTIALQGQLVRVEGRDGYRWVSSLTRDDVGDGACELVYLQSLHIVTP